METKTALRFWQVACVFLAGLVAGLLIDRSWAPGRTEKFIPKTTLPAADKASNIYGNDTVVVSLKSAVTLSEGNGEINRAVIRYENETVALRLVAPASSEQTREVRTLREQP